MEAVNPVPDLSGHISVLFLGYLSEFVLVVVSDFHVELFCHIEQV